MVYWIGEDLRPRILATTEEAMVDAAYYLAGLAGDQWAEQQRLNQTLRAVTKAELHAQIYALTKRRVAMRVNYTDADGIVIFDTRRIGSAVGKDYSQWNNVIRTLRGDYGARATRADPLDPMSVVMHVSAPIHHAGNLVGVLTVSKWADSAETFIDTAQRRLLYAGLLAAGGVIVFAGMLTIWLTRPLKRLTAYARAVGDERDVRLPDLGHGQLAELGRTLEGMRERLEGRQYVERYVQALTHEMKSPLAAIGGAAEILGDDPEPTDQQRFAGNIARETARLTALIDRLLRLASLEQERDLRQREPVDLVALVGQLVSDAPSSVAVHAPTSAIVTGDGGLIQLAIANLISNAAVFSPEPDSVDITITVAEQVSVCVRDSGPGLPAYAMDRVFDRFYSLPRPDGTKSTGLGLALVREVMGLHGGAVRLANRSDGQPGAEAMLWFPRPTGAPSP